MDEMTRKLVRLYKKANSVVESGVDKLCEIADKYDPRKDGSNGEEIIIHGTKTNINSSPIFILKKHNCPNCCSLLIKKKREKVVNSFSEEAKNYDFFSFDSYLVGNIKFITYYFECPDCKGRHSIFGKSNIEALAAEYEIHSVSKIPMNPSLAKACDKGAIELFDGDWLDGLADKVENI